MADCQLSAAPHPLANPGYGKRTVSGQLPRAADDFAHLPKREAAVAAYIDRLDDNSDISVKTPAKFTPYGQWAVSKALNHLIRVGHLRRGLEAIKDLLLRRDRPPPLPRRHHPRNGEAQGVRPGVNSAA
jgi:hypothetical protein